MKGGMFLVAVWLEKLTRTVRPIVCRAKAASRWRCGRRAMSWKLILVYRRKHVRNGVTLDTDSYKIHYFLA